MKTFFSSLLGTLVALFLFVIVLPLLLIMVLAGLASSSAPPQPDKIVLQIDLREDFPDQPSTSGLASIFGETSFIEVLEKLDAAASDDSVEGVFVRANEFGFGSARAEELRAAFLKLRSADKFVVAHSQGILGTGPSSFRAISAADEILLQPGSDILISGISFETLFMKDLFDNMSVTAEIEQFHEYKNAPNVYKESDFTEPHREAMTVLAEDLWNISLDDMASDRGYNSADRLKTIFGNGALSAEDAITVGLIDGVQWPEDAAESAIDRAGDGADFVNIADYTSPSVDFGAPVIAIVGGEGAIMTGPGEGGPFGGEQGFASDSIAAAILEAGRDDDVQAIVFRVDSPGGSAIASDQIWRAVKRVREDMGKPVIVSMGSVAASGGYYVSAGADAILANRTTITGSIGVFGGKFAIADGLRTLGINPSTITVGSELAGIFSTETLTDFQREKLREMLGRTYDRFMEIVAEGRELPETTVREIAKGRVWSGDDALSVNLINETGGYIDAIAKAKELTNITADTEVYLKHFPKPQDPLEAFSEMFGASSEAAETAMLMNQILSDERIRALLIEAQALQSGQTQMSAPVVIEQ